MAQKVKQTKKTAVATKAVAGKPTAKDAPARVAPGKGAPPAAGKSANADPKSKLRDAVALKGAAGKQPPAKGPPGKLPAGPAGKVPPGKSQGGKPVAADSKLAGRTTGAIDGKAGPSVAERARQATAAARAAAAKSGDKEAAETKIRARTKSPYSRKSLAPLKVKLFDLRARLAGDIDLMGKEALRADEPEVDAENVADYSSDAFERTITLELMENEARTLRLINEALEAMEAGKFGVCGVCGEPIPLARLEALPFASNCVKCQQAAERLL